MASSLNPGTSTSPAAKGKRTARRVTEELDIPAPPTPPRSPTTSSRSTKSSQTQQSHVPESPARIGESESILYGLLQPPAKHSPLPPIDPESRQTLTDGGGTSKRRKSTHNEEPSRKRIIPEVPRRQSKSTVAGLAEALNTAAVSNHSAFYSADVDRLSDPTSSNNNVSEAGASASTSSAKTPLAHTGPLRSSAAVFGMVQERGQDVMQIDPRRSPSIDRHDHTPLQNPASPSETDVWHPASNNVNRDVVATTPSTKRRLRPTSPTPAVSLSPSSTSARSIHPTKHPQRQVVTPTQRGENNRRQASFSIPESPAPSSSTTIAKKSHQAASRGDTRSRQPPPSGPTSYEPETSSHGPLPAPGSTATESRSVHNVLDKQPPVPASATPSQNNAVPDAAPPSTSIDENPLNNAVEELQKAIHDSQHIPSRVVNAIVALADAMNKLVAQHPQNPQNLQNTHTISPTWPQGSHPSIEDINLTEKTLNDARTTETIPSTGLDTISKTDLRVRCGPTTHTIEDIHLIMGISILIAEPTVVKEGVWMGTAIMLIMFIRNSADKSMNRANPPPSSMTNQPRPSYPVDVASQPSVQQPGEGSSGQSSSHTAPPAELLPGRDRRPLTGRESGCEQRESAIDHDLSQEEHPTSSSMNLKHSLYGKALA
ncbi:hypothetical protein C0993_012327 [Termitomyces sp. T159_Od127]|nr:hypothetical protein C0993_012327 [Termitomyces sp. T159_Od127]